MCSIVLSLWVPLGRLYWTQFGKSVMVLTVVKHMKFLGALTTYLGYQQALTKIFSGQIVRSVL